MKRVIAAALILSVFAGTAALADDRDHRRDHGRHSYERDHHHRDHGHRDHRHHDYDRRHHRHHDRHHHDRHHHGHSHHRHGVRHHHYKPWHRGAYLPHHYRRPVYVVHDYRVHRLRPPPRGYHWVRVDRDIVLTALATGLILDAVYNRY